MLGIQPGLATISHNRFKSQPDDDFIVLLLLLLLVAIAVRIGRWKGGGEGSLKNAFGEGSAQCPPARLQLCNKMWQQQSKSPSEIQSEAREECILCQGGQMDFPNKRSRQTEGEGER